MNYPSIVVILIGIHSSMAQIILPQALSPRIANYQIQANLDTREKSIRASQTLLWKNSGNQPLHELRFHLHMNAFRNELSTFLSQTELRHRRFYTARPQQRGGIDILKMKVDDRWDVTDRIEFIRPDDGNIHDSTVIRVPLPRSVLPGQQITVHIEFFCRLPRIISRTGYSDNFFLLGQWFPKIGVVQDGQWNCHQFFPNSEFFADFGVYEVEITLPAEFITGATGVLMSREVKDSLQVLKFRAEDVHDFALTAWPDFRKAEQVAGNTTITLLYAPEHAGQVSRYLETITHAMSYLNDWLVPYPYPNLTIVDVPLKAAGAAGMEYPCFFTGLSIWGFPAKNRLLPEEVTVHEYAHQYFYGMVASNEAEEPWLDEGFTSFATHKILTDRYGRNRSRSTLFNIQAGQFDYYKKAYMHRPDLQSIVNPSWEFTRSTYAVYTYDKPVMVLQTLENYLGPETMNRLMKAYVRRWQFGHPRTVDFIKMVNEIAPQNMDWFLQPALYSTKILDYLVEPAEANQAHGHTMQTSREKGFSASQVVIRRNGDMVFPVEIRCVFTDGDTLIETWDGIDSLYYLQGVGDRSLVSVEVDPEHIIWLDLNWTNNSLTCREDRRAFYRHWLQSLKLAQSLMASIFTF